MKDEQIERLIDSARQHRSAFLDDLTRYIIRGHSPDDMIALIRELKEDDDISFLDSLERSFKSLHPEIAYEG
jgi:uncharacterized protein YeeX (DUF496 family)